MDLWERYPDASQHSRKIIQAINNQPTGIKAKIPNVTFSKRSVIDER
jgi:hypothetical protein